MSGFLGAFKTRKPKQFNFSTRYYNEKKERLQKTKERVQRELQYEKMQSTNPDLETKERISFNWQKADRMAEHKKSNKRILLIVGILVTIAYIILQFV